MILSTSQDDDCYQTYYAVICVLHDSVTSSVMAVRFPLESTMLLVPYIVHTSCRVGRCISQAYDHFYSHIAYHNIYDYRIFLKFIGLLSSIRLYFRYCTFYFLLHPLGDLPRSIKMIVDVKSCQIFCVLILLVSMGLSRKL